MREPPTSVTLPRVLNSSRASKARLLPQNRVRVNKSRQIISVLTKRVCSDFTSHSDPQAPATSLAACEMLLFNF